MKIIFKHSRLLFGDLKLLLLCLYQAIRKKIGINIKFIEACNDEIVILANGPSLSYNLNNDIEYIKSKEVMMVNFSPLNDYFFEIKPKFLIKADPVFWEKDLREDILNQILLEKVKLKKVDWPLIIYLPFAAKSYNHFQDIDNSCIEIHYYNVNSFSGAHKTLLYFLYNKNILMPRAQNVLVSCIFIAIKMKYSCLKILGADHSWLNDIFVSDENILCIKDKHYYNLNGKSRPFYLNSVGQNKETFKVHEILTTLSSTFNSYWELDMYAKSKNVNIHNCTMNSFIDAFDRCQLYS